MLGLLTQNPIAFLLFAVGIVVAISVHEFFHAFVADKLGDPTPRIQGRVTLDPRAHLDPIGTLALLLVGFGWGRPVQFDPYNLKNPVRDTALIALAGPASNIVIALILAVLVRLINADWLILSLSFIIQINITLAIFNLVPVYPLDGSKIILPLLPEQAAYEYENFMQRYGLFVLLILILPIAGGVSPISQLISPIISAITTLLLG